MKKASLSFLLYGVALVVPVLAFDHTIPAQNKEEEVSAPANVSVYEHPYYGHEDDVFGDYLGWHKSIAGIFLPIDTSHNINDKLYQMLYHRGKYYPAGNNTKSITPQKYDFQDMNGDGLPDFTYHEVYFTGTRHYLFFAVFLNNGNLNFDLVYKCVAQSDGNPYDHFGDCAENAPQTYEPNQILEVRRLLSFFRRDLENTPVTNGVSIDLNGDGLMDYFGNNGLFLNKGNLEFETIQYWSS